jgi:hypothetical protein
MLRWSWSRWALAGAVGELGSSLLIARGIEAIAPNLVVDSDAGILLLAALVGFIAFGAIAVIVSIDLNDKYASHFGPAIASLIGQDDPARDQILGVIVLDFTGSATGLLLASVWQFPGIAIAIGPTLVGVFFIVALVSYVSSRFALLQQEPFRLDVMATLSTRVIADRERLIRWSPSARGSDPNFEPHSRLVADFELIAELTVRLLERDSIEAAAISTFNELVGVLDEQARTRRAHTGLTISPSRGRPSRLGVGDNGHLVHPDWLPLAVTAPAVPSDRDHAGALWFEDVASEVIAAVLRDGVRLRRRLFLLHGIALLRAQAEAADPMFRLYLIEALDAAANEDRELTRAAGNELGIGSYARRSLGQAFADLAFHCWRGELPASPDPNSFADISIRQCEFGLTAVLDSARASGDKDFAAEMYEWLHRDLSKDPWGMVEQRVLDARAKDYAAFLAATRIDDIADEARVDADVPVAGAGDANV